MEPTLSLRKEKRWSCIFCEGAETKSLTRPLFRKHLILIHSADLEKYRYPNGFWADRIIAISGERLEHQKRRILLNKCPPRVRRHLYQWEKSAERKLSDDETDFSDIPPLIPITVHAGGTRGRAEVQVCDQTSGESLNNSENWSLKEYLPELNDESSDKLNDERKETNIYFPKFVHVEGITYPRVSDILAYKSTSDAGRNESATTTDVDRGQVVPAAKKSMGNGDCDRQDSTMVKLADRNPYQWIESEPRPMEREINSTMGRRNPYDQETMNYVSLTEEDNKLISQAMTELQLFGNRNRFETVNKLLSAYPNRSRYEVELIVEMGVRTRRRLSNWFEEAICDIKNRQEALLQTSDWLLYEVRN